MFRRKLLFDVPPGNEIPYWKILPQNLLGTVWAPFYHGYGYYMDKRAFHPQDWQNVHNGLKDQSQYALLSTVIVHALSLPWGRYGTLKLIGTSILFSEIESYLAVNLENVVSFGSSHSLAVAVGYILSKSFFAKNRDISWLKISAGIVAMLQVLDFAYMWAKDGFKAVGHGAPFHRVDNVAHIGGMLVGALAGTFLI